MVSNCMTGLGQEMRLKGGLSPAYKGSGMPCLGTKKLLILSVTFYLLVTALPHYRRKCSFGLALLDGTKSN